MNGNDRTLLRPPRRAAEIEGYVPAQDAPMDGEYVAVRQEGHTKLYCTAWREDGAWRQVSDWTEQAPESVVPHAEILFAPQTNWGAQPHA